MLSKKYKLPIQDLPHSGFKPYRSKNLTLKVFNSSYTYARFGVVISKKVVKSAVQRNNLKRIIFNEVKKVKDQLSFGDYLVIINKNIEKEDLIKELNLLFKNV